MNLEEARKVYWLKNNYKPLGELLDEGFLTQARLEWAAERAYKPELKQAARIILDSLNQESKVKTEEVDPEIMDSGIEVGISLADARSTPWPFGVYKGQAMGPLVESKQLTLKDLGYAIENAWNEKVKKAAIALLLVRLEQVVEEPVPSAGFVHVVSGGRSYSERKESQLTLILGMVLGFPFAWIVGYFVRLIINGTESNPNAKQLSEIISTPAGIIALVIGIGFPILVVWLVNLILNWIEKRFDKKIEEYRLGQDGEDQTVQLIVQALDGNWHLFRNVSLPGKNKGDLDLVLVGPPGVWVLEVKNFRGTYRNIGDKWEYKAGNKWKTASADPSNQAMKNVYRLKNFLRADNINVFVNAAVVWANAESQLSVENPSVAVWRYDRLPDEIGNIWQDEKLTDVEQNRIVDKLIKLCERQKESQNSK